ncbi:hypothetical protein BEWA_036460 [Theileria equi strain WA]|uniref:Uncharacterized protein n=1 Tax=Theileria equi strain WA TaxID=1537102 RepID=L1LEC9_THEEQ|nr:hypothetical protein BEWA_036460 [Theileria equi strain WA]EKX73610.1 hypothetical protein BEWA_036460 [Theileria equi strain WA]|eukprot:XP_004833062.1 hypothetical protein BEWA_036460 [Theileria equi strain WA]
MEGTTLDLSSPDSSLFSLADDLVYGVPTFFPGKDTLLSVYTRGAGDETFCFEKVDGAWKNVDKFDFEHKLHLMKDFSAPAGEEHREEDTWFTEDLLSMGRIL